MDNPGAAGPMFDLHGLRRLWNGVYMTNHAYTRDTAKATVDEGKADLVAFGTLYIANPDLDRRLAENAPLNAPDPATFYVGGEKGYTDYPSLA